MPPRMASAWRGPGRRTGAARWSVVSGLARGIDAAAHSGALRAGQTIAVVAGGLDLPYPPEHAALQRRIAENGAVVTEAPLGTAPQSRHFPAATASSPACRSGRGGRGGARAPAA